MGFEEAKTRPTRRRDAHAGCKPILTPASRGRNAYSFIGSGIGPDGKNLNESDQAFGSKLNDWTAHTLKMPKIQLLRQVAGPFPLTFCPFG